MPSRPARDLRRGCPPRLRAARPSSPPARVARGTRGRSPRPSDDERHEVARIGDENARSGLAELITGARTPEDACDRGTGTDAGGDVDDGVADHQRAGRGSAEALERGD